MRAFSFGAALASLLAGMTANELSPRSLRYSPTPRRRRWARAQYGSAQAGRLTRAARRGYVQSVAVKDPDKYLNSHARTMMWLKRALA